MNQLSPEDLAHVVSAQECLKAGNHAGASEALSKITAETRRHPDALEIAWEIHANAQEWEMALAISRSLCELAPESQFGWMYQACSLSELKQQAEAYEVLVIAAGKFPEVPTIPYNLACCACKLGRLKDASSWVAKAIEVGGRAEIKLMALDDPDLAPLVDEICAM
jgi:predicted Zn-dependent protease